MSTNYDYYHILFRRNSRDTHEHMQELKYVTHDKNIWLLKSRKTIIEFPLKSKSDQFLPEGHRLQHVY